MANFLPKCEYEAFPDGIDLELFQPADSSQARQKLGLPEGKKLILFAADPSGIIKRFDLAQAASEIVKQKLAAELVIANALPHEQMPLYMNACDVLVLTSQHEGSPNVIKEALACNLPVVSLDVGDVRSRIGSASNCAICETDNPEEIADALVKVLQQGRKDNLRELVLDLDMRLIADRKIVMSKDPPIRHEPLRIRAERSHRGGPAVPTPPAVMIRQFRSSSPVGEDARERSAS